MNQLPSKDASHDGDLEAFLALDDFTDAAKRRLPRPLFGYLVGGAELNTSRDRNPMTFRNYMFVPRVLRNVTSRTIEAELFGQSYAAPFGIAPMGISALMAFEGDLILARAAKAANIPMIVSGASLTSLEKVHDENPDAWFQAYFHYDNGQIDKMIERVEAAGYQTLVVTVDSAIAANRENNFRAGFRTPLRPSVRLMLDGLARPRWLVETFLRTLLTTGMPHFENSGHQRGAPVISPSAVRDMAERGRLDWNHIRFIRQRWKGHLVLKGILSAADAKMAEACGVDGIIVSNHGGRQLDSAISPLEVLPEIVAAVSTTTVMIDSGFRRGADIIKAWALGARFVFVGRPMIYAAAVKGERGVRHAINLLAQEVSRNVGLLGCRALSEVDPTYIRAVTEWPQAVPLPAALPMHPEARSREEEEADEAADKRPGRYLG